MIISSGTKVGSWRFLGVSWQVVMAITNNNLALNRSYFINNKQNVRCANPFGYGVVGASAGDQNVTAYFRPIHYLVWLTDDCLPSSVVNYSTLVFC